MNSGKPSASRSKTPGPVDRVVGPQVGHPGREVEALADEVLRGAGLVLLHQVGPVALRRPPRPAGAGSPGRRAPAGAGRGSRSRRAPARGSGTRSAAARTASPPPSGTDCGCDGSGSNRRAVSCSPQKSPGRASIRANTSSSGRSSQHESLASSTSSYAASAVPADQLAGQQAPRAEVVAPVRAHPRPGREPTAARAGRAAATRRRRRTRRRAGPARRRTPRRSRRPARPGRTSRTGRPAAAARPSSTSVARPAGGAAAARGAGRRAGSAPAGWWRSRTRRWGRGTPPSTTTRRSRGSGCAAPASPAGRSGRPARRRARPGLVVGEVAGLVDRAGQPDHGDLAAPALADRRPRPPRAGRGRARPRRAPAAAAPPPAASPRRRPATR